jgi:hypothetical protein
MAGLNGRNWPGAEVHRARASGRKRCEPDVTGKNIFCGLPAAASPFSVCAMMVRFQYLPETGMGRNRPIVNAGSGLEEVNCEDPNAEALADPLGFQPGAV